MPRLKEGELYHLSVYLTVWILLEIQNHFILQEDEIDMIFRDMAYENDHRKEQREGKLPVFNKEYHLAALYLFYLGDKFILDGCGKLTIFLKHREDKPKYYYWNFEGASRYYLDDDQVDLYFSIDDKEQADIILCNYTHDALIDILKRNDYSEERIERIHYARDEIIKNNFSLSYEMTKYSKTDRSRRYRALVFRNINRDLAESWSVRIIDKKDGDRIICERYLKYSPLYCNGIYRYHKTIWEGNSFKFLDRNGVVWDKIEVLPEMGKR